VGDELIEAAFGHVIVIVVERARPDAESSALEATATPDDPASLVQGQ
jgi:hypothetical protein